MARVARIVVPGLSHYVLHRARPGVALFRDETDYNQFEDLLRDSCALYDTELQAFRLMPYRVQVVLRPRSRDALARTMGETARLYARSRSPRGADLWLGRFRSCPLDEAHGEAALAWLTGNREVAPQMTDLIEKSAMAGRPAGSAEFYARLEYELGRRLSPLKRGRKAKW